MPPSPGLRVTLYVSPDDKALAAASWLFGSIVRLGRIDATILSADQIEAIALLHAVDIIQVSGTSELFRPQLLHFESARERRHHRAVAVRPTAQRARPAPRTHRRAVLAGASAVI
jgi:esterase/lipase superfamily enzyme